MTGGRFVVNFRYLGGGKAVGAVLHAEEYGEGFDFKNLVQNVDAFWETALRFHRLWMFDLEAGTAAPVRGIDAFTFISPGFFHTTLDGRTFVFLQDGMSADYARTIVYEFDKAGNATRHSEVTGNLIQWLKVR